MGTMRRDQLVTVEDLENFKLEIITVIRQVITDSNGRPVKKWLKSAEARKLIGVSPGKLQTIKDNGMLAYTKIGGNIYYDQDDLFRLFDDHRISKK